MDDLMGFIVLAASIGLVYYFVRSGRNIYSLSKDPEIAKKYGRFVCEFLNGMAYMHFTVAAVPVIWFFIIFLSALRDEGGSELPVFIAVVFYAVLCIAAVIGHRRWWGRLSKTEIINGGSDVNEER